MGDRNLPPCTLGVVSGEFGGAALMSLDGKTIRLLPMPCCKFYSHTRTDIAALVAWIRAIQDEFEIRLIVVERVKVNTARPSTVTLLDFIKSIYQFGLVYGALEALGIPLQLVRHGGGIGGFRLSRPTFVIETDEVDGVPPVKQTVVCNTRGRALQIAPIAKSANDQVLVLNRALGLAGIGRSAIKRLPDYDPNSYWSRGR